MVRRCYFTILLAVFAFCLLATRTTHAQNAQGEINVLSYGAKCDGTTDDTIAFNNAINDAFRSSGNGYPLLIPSTGNSCIVSQLNLTNIYNRIYIKGQTSISGFESTIQCSEGSPDSSVCVDFTGSAYITMEHIQVYGGTSASTAPRVTVLLAKSTTGNSQIIHWDDVTVQGYGDFQVYDFGGEVWSCNYCTFYQGGPGGVDLVRISAANTAGISSPFTTIASAPVSMGKVNLWATWSAGGTSDALDIDSSTTFLPAQITIGGFGNLGSAPYFIHDSGTGEIHGLTLRDLRVEPFCISCGLLSLSNAVVDLIMDNVQWAASSPPTVTLANFQNEIQVADIYLRPGDGQLQFPSVPVVTCSGRVIGVIIRDNDIYGGGPQSNSCPGAIEIFNNWSVDGQGNFTIGGNLYVRGTLSKSAGSFKIDDPLDPANKYLSHSFVESPDMMNVYNGNITTDKRGFAVVPLPAYFEALNRDFRYQLTPIGQFAQAIVAKEISGNRFTIRTNKPRVKVSWQVTGIRHDAYANAHPIPIEEAKPPAEQGHYLYPELFGASKVQAVGHNAEPFVPKRTLTRAADRENTNPIPKPANN